MSPLHMSCGACGGLGHDVYARAGASPWPLCRACGGVGYVFVPGAPAYGCELVLGDRVPGEVVTLGNGDHGRVLRHYRSGTPTTWLGLIGEFSGIESHTPVAYPSSAGVAEINQARAPVERHRRTAAHSVDPGDPLQRQFQLRGAI